MPTFAINPAHTFSTAIIMGTSPKTEYGSDVQSRTDTGLPRWECQVAVTFISPPGARVQSDVLSVTVAAEQDPALRVAPGSLVELVDLRLGVSAPEARDGGRIRGGKPWFQAGDLRPAAAARPPKDQAADGAKVA
jgi:hypothetical protein